jgi:uncharacterized membrane protein YoaK (UPF0700 family)
MFRHKGQRRTFKHNFKLAILLSSTAGIVNVAGFISFAIYTTNVTGHVANFAKELSEGNFYLAEIIALWMVLFLLGAFFSSLLIDIIGKRAARFSHTVPLFIEAMILFFVGYLGQNPGHNIARDHFFAGCLLFAMGMQNAMVSMVSGFIVRTTHLTGLFTDLGIELSRLFFIPKENRKELNRKIVLHSSIVIMFIAGGIFAGFSYQYFAYKIFMIAAFILIFALFYDSMRLGIYMLKRKFIHKFKKAS